MNQPTAPAASQSEPSYPFPRTELICLTGFMGAGKTTVGKLLAQELHYGFVDLDDAIEQREGARVTEIFATRSEAAFRELEFNVLKRLLEVPRRVIALGGGAFLQSRIAGMLQECAALTIFLDGSAEELYARCVDSLDAPSRPLLQDLASFKKLYAERLPGYRQAAWHVSTSGAEAPAIVREITQRLRAESTPRKDL